MFHRFIPTFHAKSIYDIDIGFYASQGIRNLLIDLDNTLGSYRDLHPSREAVALIRRFIDHGYNVIIISNNKGPRVTTYADNLGVRFLASAGKPFKKKLSKLIHDAKLKKAETILIGDQLLTDTIVAKRLGIRIILTEKIVPEDQWTTRFNRLLDRPIRAYLRKNNHLKEWDKSNDRN